MILSETDERFNTVRDEEFQPHTRHPPRSALEYISSEGLGNRHTELEILPSGHRTGIRLMQSLLIVVYVLLAGTVTIHVLLTKSDVRAALGWIAVA